MQSYMKTSAAPLACLVVTIGTMIAGPAIAQQLEEIVVTAERRALSLQDTPISVLAFTGESLELRGVRDLFDLANLAPNLEIKGSRGTGNTSPIFEIRGISGGGGATGERSVGFYIDNVFMPRTTGPVMRVLDVERVEVLRGPQGTLFGRNSTGGAIRIFSKQPNAERDSYIKVTAGNFGHGDVSGMINVPLSDNVFLRAQGASLHEQGFVTRGPQKLGGSDDSVARLQIGWRPTDKLSLTFGVLHTNSESDGSPTDMTVFNMNPVCPLDPTNPFYCLQGNYADWVSDFLQSSGQERLRQNDQRLVRDAYSMPDWCFLDDSDPDWNDLCRQWNKARYSQVDANIKWEIGEHVSMTSTTGVSKFASSGVSDWQLLGMEFRPDAVNSDVVYQEVQFDLALANGKIDLVTGMNYFKEDSGSPRLAVLNAIGSSVFNATTGGAANGNLWGCNDTLAVPCTGSTIRRIRRTGDGLTNQTSTAYGLFVNSTIHLGKVVSLTTGLRQSLDEKQFTSTLFAADNFIPQNGVSSTVSAADDWRATDWRGTLEFQANKDFMVYVTSSKAFRSGTFATPAPLAVTPTRPYNLRPSATALSPETLYNSEIGARTEWWNGRFRFNVTRYNMKYTDRQGASAVADATSPTGFTIQLVNQGDVALAGTEIELMLAVTDRLSLEAATGRADYAMANVCVNNGPFLFPPPMDREHSFSARYEIPASKGTYDFSFSYTKTGPMQTHPGGFTPAENAIYNCGAFAATFIDSRYEVPSYSLMNAALRFTTRSGKWSTTLFANNLTNEVYANNAQSFGRGFWTVGGPGGAAGLSAPARSAIADYRGRPREYGLTFQLNFKP